MLNGRLNKQMFRVYVYCPVLICYCTFIFLVSLLLTVVFMGSKKYKKENAFDDFIAKHGGETNAWTDAERVRNIFSLCKAKKQASNAGKKCFTF